MNGKLNSNEVYSIANYTNYEVDLDNITLNVNMTASSVGVFSLLINSTFTAKNIVFNAIVSDAGLM